MIKISCDRKNGTWHMLDSRIVKTMLTRNGIEFSDFRDKFNNCEFLVDESIINTEAFYKTCVILDAAYDIELSSSHSSMLTIESMRMKLANMLTE